MKTKLNLILIYISRFYMAIVSIILVPFFLNTLGTEAYGLIGVFVVLQACLQVLDAGIGGVMTRQCILTKNDAESFDGFSELFKKLFLIFFLVGFLISIFGYLFSDYLAVNWLDTTLDMSLTSNCIALMFVIFSFRYLQGPFRSILLANEKHILLSVIDIVFVTISNPLALVYVYYADDKIISYFLFQTVSSAFRLVVLGCFSSFLLVNTRKFLLNNTRNVVDVVKSDFSSIIKFGFQLSFISILWVLVTQTDKLTLTSVMPLSDYAFYTLAISVVSVVNIFSSPINQFLQPRLTSLYAAKDFSGYTRVFENSFLYLSIFLIPACFIVFYFGNNFISIWLGSEHKADVVMSYVPLLFTGAVLTVLSNFCFLLLFSHGRLKWHTIFYTFFSIIVIVFNIYIAKEYKANGIVVFYFFSCLFLFLFWANLNFFKYFNRFHIVFFYKLIPSILISYLFFYVANFFRFKRLYLDVYLALGTSVLCVLVLYLWCFKFIPNIFQGRLRISYRNIG
ncbi:oligosaccharide flippase family protein [Shewanella sp. S1-58-MNA-CIBAN-0166]|uniref:lipopolysaccharide biosynthesis protein n=1 Tax=Shewanella sp. S1-58-MNA-CIBAN-0166 TaxID=3140467 RepID=UPI00332B8973